MWGRGLLVVWLCAVVPAHARADDREDQARQAFNAGVHAAEAGDYASALAHYRRSYAALARPRTLFNLASVAEHLQLDEEAYSAYKTFVATATARERDSVAQAQRRIAQLGRKLQATLVLRSQPSGATVYVDGETLAAGRTPLTVRLPPGDHRFRIAADGRAAEQVVVTLAPRANETRSVVLGSETSELRIHADAPSAQVRIDDITIGSTPSDSQTPLTHEVVPGEHRVTVETAGHQSVSRAFHVDSGGRIDLHARLQPTRSRTNKLVLGTVFAVGIGLAAVAGYHGAHAVTLEDSDGPAADRASRLADRFGIGAAVLTAGAVVGFVITMPEPSTLDIHASD